MKEWKEYLIKVNGFEMKAVYNEETIREVFLPLLKHLHELQKQKNERLIVFMAAPPAVGKTTLSQFLEYLSKEEQELTEIQVLGLDGFHYHSDYINSHDAVVFGETVPMKQVKGCPETYDTAKVRKKLEKIKTEDILWPIYDRNLHDVVEDQIKVTKDIILIEGNWLLLKQEPWRSMQQYADYKILILAEEEMLKERLVSRKEKGGSSREEAEAWYQNSDSKNVTRVLRDSLQGDLLNVGGMIDHESNSSSTIRENQVYIKEVDLPAIRGGDHKRVPDDVSKEHPVITGHEFGGSIVKVGEKNGCKKLCD